ncbi:6a5e0a33-2b36-4719-bd1b-16d5a346a61a [Thermothielavioides terrestris]|uniref:6a5e0a33-2b36-4719-bd1b-16d5a346a61a n=1 Tax=Thermothielavioides terrestris TaxID=2587410 RepID=A0A3S5CX12_9PEZI|nr:6a5e0a33-2b36-4719-bd1b-16d5a346a61a [Thermothielavioides terrestris]
MRSLGNWAKRIAPVLAVLVLLGLHAGSAHASRSAPGATTAASAPAPAVTEVCESRTINYITHTLPQQCLRTSWTSPTPAATETDNSTVHPTITTVVPSDLSDSPASAQDNGTAAQEQDAQEELSASSFMSFEEWKEMMLRKSGQDPASIKAHKQREHRERDPGAGSGTGDADSFGEEGEISLDFDALAAKVSEITSPSPGATVPDTGKDVKEEQILYDDGKTQYYRSKDAGKTCKERFSYASFDAGATVLKTSPGAKNAKAVLVENKDSYMLMECRTKNKFIIVELSDDILVDTVVLANFEFFSSMIRKFRVSVSDRYPVKMDKWVDLGTFEARNSRDIQAFLIEHPQIYTKYIRIEFLSHWGNEFYCPVSLLRVHGTRMLDTWKEPSHDDEPDHIEGSGEEQVTEVHNVQGTTAGNDDPSAVEQEESIPQATIETGLTPWRPIFFSNFSLEMCELRSPTTPEHVKSDSNKPANKSVGAPDSVTPRPSPVQNADEASQPSSISASEPASSHTPVASPGQATSVPPSAVASPPQTGNNSTASGSSQKQADGRTDTADSSASATTTTSRNKTSSVSSSPSASPTVQESFFKTVTKRLQLLESNTSLSLQYIEEQSRFLQDVLLKMERKQITRVDAFLDTLNKTVLSELRNVRTQYDQIWQSTVIALETQREQSEREIVALTSRLNILADEVVFQKRMAIIQSVMLLCCLVLVIFARGGLSSAVDSTSFSAFPQSTTPYRRHGSSYDYGYSSESMAGSPSPRPGSSPPSRYATTGSDASASLAASALPRRLYTTSYRDKTLPLTPPSEYSRESTPVTRLHTSPEPRPPTSSYDQDPDRVASEEAGQPLRHADPTPSPSPGPESNGAPAQADAADTAAAASASTKIPSTHTGTAPQPSRQPALTAAPLGEAEQGHGHPEPQPQPGRHHQQKRRQNKPDEEQDEASAAQGQDINDDDDDNDDTNTPPRPVRAHSTTSHLVSSSSSGGGGSGGSLRKPLPALPEDAT